MPGTVSHSPHTRQLVRLPQPLQDRARRPRALIFIDEATEARREHATHPTRRGTAEAELGPGPGPQLLWPLSDWLSGTTRLPRRDSFPPSTEEGRSILASLLRPGRWLWEMLAQGVGSTAALLSWGCGDGPMSLAQGWKAGAVGTMCSHGATRAHTRGVATRDHAPPPRAPPSAQPPQAQHPHSAGAYLGIPCPRLHRSGRDTGGGLQRCTSGSQSLPDRGTAL